MVSESHSTCDLLGIEIVSLTPELRLSMNVLHIGR